MAFLFIFFLFAVKSSLQTVAEFASATIAYVIIKLKGDDNMPIQTTVIDNNNNSYAVTEIQYGGAGNGGGNRGFYITPPRQLGNRAAYDIMPNPHGNPSYNRPRQQANLYETAAGAVVNAANAANPFTWPANVNFVWEGVNYTSTLQ